MASIKEHKDKDGKTRFHVQIRIKGTPPQYASFKRKTDAERWIQQTESAIREGRHFKSKRLGNPPFLKHTKMINCAFFIFLRRNHNDPQRKNPRSLAKKI